MIGVLLADGAAAATGLDTFTLSIGALTTIATTAAAWGTLRATVKGQAEALLKLEQELRRVSAVADSERGDIEDRVHHIELRFEREKGRNEMRRSSKTRSPDVSETSTFERPRKRDR